jgi:NAD(P)-dependent dehydrogenase (short-subunit alcohol dehydrogenase family)
LKVFITGASSGIGEALAVYYAAQGATLGLVARRADFLHGLNERLGGGHACYPLDVTDAPALHDAATDFMQRFGAPHIVIANAGVSAGTLTECEEDLAVFRRVMDTNVFGMAATFAPFIPAMRQPAASVGWPALPRSPAFAACRARRPIRPQGRRHRLSGKPASGNAALWHQGGDHCAGLYRNADDGDQSVQDALPAAGRQSGRPLRPPSNAAPATR